VSGVRWQAFCLLPPRQYTACRPSPDSALLPDVYCHTHPLQGQHAADCTIDRESTFVESIFPGYLFKVPRGNTNTGSPRIKAPSVVCCVRIVTHLSTVPAYGPKGQYQYWVAKDAQNAICNLPARQPPCSGWSSLRPVECRGPSPRTQCLSGLVSRGRHH